MKWIKRILIGLLVALACYGLYSGMDKYAQWTEHKQEITSDILLEKVQTVMKLVAVEGQFSEIYNYKDYVFSDVWAFRKTALVRVNAKVAVGYDLENLKIDIDEENKIMTITDFPEAEIISIEHDLEYYDLNQGLFNPITTTDITEMSNKAKDFIEKQALNSELFTRVSEQKLESIKMIQFLLENTGWELKQNQKAILN